MKDYNIERILSPAFMLFLTYNYESVSTAKLEDATGLTRGAIFFKFKTKEALFKAVVDKYILDFQSDASNIKADSLKSYIDLFIQGIESRMNEMFSLGIRNVHKGYFNLLYQALQYYPGFSEKISLMFESSLEDWKKIIHQAKESGEIKATCNINEVAQRFRYIYSGMAFEDSFHKGLDISRLKNNYYAYYNEIVYEK